MKTKLFSLLLTAGVTTFATPAIANSAESEAKLSFSCQTIEGVATTVAESPTGDVQIPVFHWQPEVLANRTSDSPQELCNDVAQKLETLSVDYDLSNLNFIGTTMMPEGDIPTVCATTGGSQCSKVLFSLNATNEETASVVAGNVVDAILDKNLEPQITVLRTRGVQSISYQVDFWSLLGLGIKSSYKY